VGATKEMQPKKSPRRLTMRLPSIVVSQFEELKIVGEDPMCHNP